MTITHKFDTDPVKRRFPKITLVVILALVSLGVLEIWVSHTLASYGEKFEGIERLRQTLSLENRILENEISTFDSLSNIASQSGTLGLNKPSDIQYIR